MVEVLTEFYRGAEFVTIEAGAAAHERHRGDDYSALHALVDGDTIVVCSVLDNLLKGAAGGSIQWANRLLGLPESLGLTAPAAGWL